MKRISSILKHLYQSTLIPVYVYRDRELLYSFPDSAGEMPPPSEPFRFLMESDESVAYVSTAFFAYYGAVRLIDEPGLIVIAGPVSQLPYSADSIRIMRRAFMITESEAPKFDAFLRLVPPTPLQQFLNHLISLHFFLNGIEIRSADLLRAEHIEQFDSAETSNAYDNKESAAFNNSYEVEMRMCGYVETGNEKGLAPFIEQPFNLHEGTIAGDDIRQAKNTSIVTLTLITRAAIRGGLETEAAYGLSDLYIRQIEKSGTLQPIQNLMQEALFHFTRRVAETRYKIAESENLKPIVRYVWQNTNRPLTVAELAERFGYNRTYLSTVFKKETGISLRSFITDCKLEEAKNLLLRTGKPISEIANYLCFSSQSHFQTAFKQKFAISPAKYRKQAE